MTEQTSRIIIKRAALHGLRAELSLQRTRCAAEESIALQHNDTGAADAYRDMRTTFDELVQRVDHLITNARDFRTKESSS